jgi:glycosyltransferase involved in cell wall biosynthesis
MNTMRVLVTADPFLPVPPAGYGGIERVVALLVEALADRGHDVTLVAHPESRTRATLLPYGGSAVQGRRAARRDVVQLMHHVWARSRQVDVVHSFGRLAGLAPVLPLALPKVQSYQRAIPWAGVQRAVWLAGSSLQFTACSTALRANAQPRHGAWHTVPNPVDTRRYTARTAVAADAPLVFLGRLEAIKGVREAIAIARAAGRTLIIAGNRVDSAEGRRYFTDAIAPQVDGTSVQYLGEIDDARKNDLLGHAAALLMPIQWEEPFGIVMIEALACGTPVIAFDRGSVREVVREGVTGFIRTTVADAAAAVGQLHQLDRHQCRDDAERRFGIAPVVDAYERLYRSAVAARVT